MKRKISIDDFCHANVWSYTRVSTKDQFINNGSIETQVKTIKKFAKYFKKIKKKCIIALSFKKQKQTISHV